MAKIIRVRTVLQYGSGGPGLATHYFFGAGATPVTADMTDVAGRVRLFWDALKTLLYTGTTCQVQGAADVLEDSTGKLTGGLAVTNPAVVTGTGGATPLPPSVQVLARLETANVVRNRRVHGRVFVGQLSTVAQTNGAPSASVPGAVTAAVATLLTGATASAAVVWQRPNALKGYTGQSSSITSGSTMPVFAILRSRRD